MFLRAANQTEIMYVRDARNRDEAWLLDHIEEMNLDGAAFRSRDYVIAVDEQTNTRAGFGRVRLHKDQTNQYCELTSTGVLPEWQNQGVGAHIIERLVDNAANQDFDTAYAFVDRQDHYEQFGFRPIEEDDLPAVLAARLEEKRNTVMADAAPMRVATAEFVMPAEYREAFKRAGETEPHQAEPEETPEDFGIDPDTATYKYDTGR